MNSSGLIFGPVATLAISKVLIAATTTHSTSPNSIDAKTAPGEYQLEEERGDAACGIT